MRRLAVLVVVLMSAWAGCLVLANQPCNVRADCPDGNWICREGFCLQPDQTVEPDAGPADDAGSLPDGGAMGSPDAGVGLDAGTPGDGGSPMPDAGAGLDAGAVEDAGADAGGQRPVDAGVDGGSPELDAGPIVDAGRADAGLVLWAPGASVIWSFNEDAGTEVIDRSGSGQPIDLTIQDPENVSWGGGGLTIETATSLTANVNKSRLVDECTEGGGITIEAWVSPTTEGTPEGLRIVTYSDGSVDRNFQLGQRNGQWQARLRTQFSFPIGDPVDPNGAGILAGTATAGGSYHLALRFEATDGGTVGGPLELFVDETSVGNGAGWIGELTGSGPNHGGWQADFQLTVGNEANVGGTARAFLGTLDSITIYCRALTDLELDQNHKAGPR